MEAFNQAMFLYLNAPANASAFALVVTRVVAEDLMWIVPAGLLIGWLRGGDAVRRAMLQATLAGIVSQACAQLIGMLWPHPRPFMIGLGHWYLAHVPDASFPSDHLTLWWATSSGPTSWNLNGSSNVPFGWDAVGIGMNAPCSSPTCP